jgi:hypothetical protein
LHAVVVDCWSLTVTCHEHSNAPLALSFRIIKSISRAARRASVGPSPERTRCSPSSTFGTASRWTRQIAFVLPLAMRRTYSMVSDEIDTPKAPAHESDALHDVEEVADDTAKTEVAAEEEATG